MALDALIWISGKSIGKTTQYYAFKYCYAQLMHFHIYQGNVTRIFCSPYSLGPLDLVATIGRATLKMLDVLF
ncbi:hypothetical protein [Pinibacter soli]|uniref:Uncharacterized protein n=1 Tax=Pinibacter soli TaxID=3044211 RepID=A0ABT6RDP6_9BACT|nr:hypothetical protein [Pinibacter soli]MDI3320694.1 hypothetical protein [Pinibacter soli]